MKEYRVGLDIDGCVLQTYEPFLKETNKRHGTNFKFSDMTSYGVDKIVGITVEELIDIFASIDDRDSPLCDPNCPKVIDNLRSEGYIIELVTAHIPHKTMLFDPLLEALDNYKINYDLITFVDNRSNTVKGQMASLFDYMLDDAPHHIMEMGVYTKAILYDAPYNVNVDIPSV